MYCKLCGIAWNVYEVDIEVKKLKNGGKHHKASCPTCSRFMKFLNKEEKSDLIRYYEAVDQG